MGCRVAVERFHFCPVFCFFRTRQFISPFRPTCRHATRRSGNLPRDTAPETSNDVFRNTIEGHSSDVQEIHGERRLDSCGIISRLTCLLAT